MLGYLNTCAITLAQSRIEASNSCLAVSGTIAFKPPRSLDTKLEIGVSDRLASRLNLTFGDRGLFSIQATAVARVPWYNLDQSNILLALAVAWPMVVGGCMYNDAGLWYANFGLSTARACGKERFVGGYGADGVSHGF
jgi:hypothetical protein